ncbi:hypothetical protein GCM10023170_086150 [Phytohabitans houttuyneae]|uniref:Uncharacterized protein n=1 Tax=Phytohabitans houttuyneae TaxID=1076126 RepID=A0A6V8K8C2_9ACTN|nr:hypothetical protein Phou_024260 [Phytohabitans houttuyneae]
MSGAARRFPDAVGQSRWAHWCAQVESLVRRDPGVASDEGLAPARGSKTTELRPAAMSGARLDAAK